MRVGITGSYASGKGTVCGFFENLGAKIIDTDIISREITVPGSPCLSLLIDAFGSIYLNEDGSLNRRMLGKFVFADPVRVVQLNAITHPFILKEILEQTADKGSVFMINAPVLIEAGFHTCMDAVIVIKSSDEQSVLRGIKRDGLTEEEIRHRLKNQISLNEKLKIADYVIDNSGTLENTRKQVVTIWNNLKISSREVQR